VPFLRDEMASMLWGVGTGGVRAPSSKCILNKAEPVSISGYWMSEESKAEVDNMISPKGGAEHQGLFILSKTPIC
jgi:hypothetical protein